MTPLKIDNEMIEFAAEAGGTVVLRIRDEIDLHNSPELRSLLLDLLENQRPRKMVLNLANVPYMDSSAVAVLVELLQKMRRQGSKLALCHLQARVRGLLEIARLDNIFTVAADETAALKL